MCARALGVIRVAGADTHRFLAVPLRTSRCRLRDHPHDLDLRPTSPDLNRREMRATFSQRRFAA
jgi:hypothetical protein